MNPYEIIHSPRITEKAVHLQGKANCYTFKVHPKANKIEIKDAIEKVYSVKVAKINTVNCDGKLRRTRRGTGYTADWKKAYVTLAVGQKIEGV